MSHLPVIVGFGGINAAGRSSAHHGYRRLVLDRLPRAEAEATLRNLAVLMGLLRPQGPSWCDAQGMPVDVEAWITANRQLLLDGTLIRRLETNLFDCTS